MAQRTLLDKAETFGIVTVVAVLVWLYAEGASTTERNREPVRVRFVAPDGQERDYAVDPDQAVSLNVSFRGSGGQVQRFNDLVRDPLEVPVEPPQLGQTTRTVVLADELARTDLGELGLSNLVVEPPTYEVRMRRLETVSLPVHVQSRGLRLDPETTPQATPDRVQVTAPADVVARLSEAVVLAPLDADVAGAGAGGGAAGAADPSAGRERVARNVTLRWPEAIDRASPWTRLSTDVVRVNYTLADPEATVIVPRVPLYVNLPVGTQETYRVTPNGGQKFLFDVELRGPRGVIDRIAEGDPDYPVTAEVRISDVAGIETVTSAQPVVVPPPGVTVVGAPPRIGVRVERRL